MKFGFLLLLCLSQITAFANADTGGIKFVRGQTWNEIKDLAKKDNKYIFLDCYTTWCGPCKAMDKHVFSNDAVANFFNDHFISVRVQMDRTKNDGDWVQQWYDTADAISKRYKIAAYPSFVFLSPEGQIVHKETGYKPTHDFIKVAETALEPGRVYDDPFARYDSLVAEYKKGRKNYSKMLYMIEQATNANDVDIKKQLRKDYKMYLENANSKILYKKENIAFISSFVDSNSKFFRLFYPDGRRVDEIMNHLGYAAKVVDRIIYNDILKGFGIEYRPDGVVWGGKITDSTEAEWAKIYDTILLQYNKYYAERTLLTAKIYWYVQHKNFPAACKYYFEKLNKYGIDTLEKFPGSSALMDPVVINSYSWNVFLWLDDKELLNQAIKWMQQVLKIDTGPGYIDTYANLLYKVGRVEEALLNQEKAVHLAIKANDQWSLDEIVDHLNKMKLRKPTWKSKQPAP